ncbi:MAG: ROK family transcriptional regulator [Maritimibacter sp.]|nr:ROK family transcriptional regulator [Maritimibacter sp.]
MHFTDRKKIDQKTGRAINRRLILNLIRRNGPMSRSDLALRTGLSPAAVGFVVTDLLDDGYLIAGAPSQVGSGRRPVPLALNVDGHLAVGLKAAPGRVDCILADFGINTLESRSVALTDRTPAGFVATTAEAIRSLLATHGGGRPVIGVGLSIPGRVVPDTGHCIRSHRFGWADVPIGPMLSREVGLPVYVEDDTMAYGLAHHMFGLGQACENFAALAVGDGIGYAVIMDGKIRQGALGNAGKVGHVMHDAGGPMCECGRTGCLQAWYSFAALESRWRETRATKLLDALEKGAPEARAMVAEAGREIGRHLGEWVTVSDPERIVLGGEAVALGRVFIDAMEAALAVGYFRETAPPIVADESSYYWTAGAAAVAVQHVFDFEAAPSGSDEELEHQPLSTIAP